MLLKRTKSRRFFPKTIGSNNSFTLIEKKKNQVFKIAKFEFKVTEHYGLRAKGTQLWALKRGTT